MQDLLNCCHHNRCVHPCALDVDMLASQLALLLLFVAKSHLAVSDAHCHLPLLNVDLQHERMEMVYN